MIRNSPRRTEGHIQVRRTTRAGQAYRNDRECKSVRPVGIGGTWSETPGKLWKVGRAAEERARKNPAFPPLFHLAAALIRRCCTSVPGVFDQVHLHPSPR